MSWEKILKAVPNELKEFIEIAGDYLLDFKNALDNFYSKQNDTVLVKLLDEANELYESLDDRMVDMAIFLELLEQNERIMQERFQ